MRTFLTLLVVAVTCAWAPPARAWNKAGHMVTGAIAYDVLKADSPESVAKVVAILKGHRDYEKYWAPKLADLPAEDRDRALFMLAARWADDVRNNKELDHPTWHYINIPYKPAGEPASLETAPPLPINVVTQFKANLDIATGKGPADRQSADAKSLAVGWLFHLVGDVHQPLHAVALFSRQFPPPAGDRGGTFFYVRATTQGRPVSLHKIWDDLILGGDNFQDARNRATELRLDPELAKDKLTELSETDFEKWASAESLTLAKEKVYAFNGQPIAGAKSGARDTPVLPDGYLKEAQRVGYRRAVLAGYRLAAVLKGLP